MHLLSVRSGPIRLLVFWPQVVWSWMQDDMFVSRSLWERGLGHAVPAANNVLLETVTHFSLGAFLHSAGTARAQRAHSANYYGDYPGNNPENHPPTESCTINSKLKNFKHLMLAMGPRDLNSAPYGPVHCSSHSMTSFQSSELTELPVVENSQLFARTAQSTPPLF